MHFHFDSQYNDLRLNTNNGQPPYYPYVFGLNFQMCVSDKYFYANPVKRDKQGNKWQLVPDFSLRTVNLARLSRQCDESALMRDILLKEKCKDLCLRGAAELRDHGWKNAPGLNYTWVQEEQGEKLYYIEQEEQADQRAAGSTQLFGARCLSTVLDLVESLYVHLNLVVTSISTLNVYLREDYLTGYLDKLDAVSHGTEATTTGYPCYKTPETHNCSITDAYLAVLVIMAKCCNYRGFQEACKEESGSRYFMPFNFLKSLVSGRRWGAHSPELKRLIQDLTKSYKVNQHFTEQTRLEIRTVVGLIGHQGRDQPEQDGQAQADEQLPAGQQDNLEPSGLTSNQVPLSEASKKIQKPKGGKSKKAPKKKWPKKQASV